MLDGLTIDTTAFASSYSKLKEGGFMYKSDMREQLAEANNCIAIGAGSCYADMVAVPKDYPDVVIKICSGTDAFIPYARLCANGTLKGKHHLLVHSEAEIAPGVWLFVMERLEGGLTQRQWEMTVARAANGWFMPERGRYAGICKTLRADLDAIRSAFSVEDRNYCEDLHRGNVMFRKDGTIVLLDPVC